MNMPAHEGLLAPSDIADLAGVSRAAVSNWRKRLSDFPEPTEGTASKPLFAAKDIEAWLTAHPDKRKPDNSADSTTRAWESRLWGVANLFRGHVDVRDFGELFLRTAVEFVDGRPSLASRNVSQRSLDELRDALETIPRADLPAAIDGLLERTSRALGKAGGETGFVGSRTSTLLASLAADADAGTLYDPACGIGVALLQALDMGATPDRLVGDEINATAAEIALGRAAMRGVDLELRITDVLRNDPDPDLRADVIIAEPPYGLRVDPETTLLDPRLRFGIPPRSSGDSYWLQHVVAHLAPGGVGYVLTSPGTLFRGGAEAQIRRNLLLGGWVRAVVALTGKMLPQTSIAPVLWVLGESEPSARGSVLLVDASKVEAPEADVAKWLADEASLVDVPHARVPLDELAAGNADLSPARWMLAEEVDGARLVEEFDRASALLLQASIDLPATVRYLEPPHIPGQPPVLTVASLVEAGALEVAPVRPQLAEGASDHADRQVSTSDVRSGSLPPISDLPSADTSGFLTQPDDVLVSTTHGIRAVIDESGGHLPIGHGMSRIRVVDRTKLDPHYLADVLAGEWNSRFAAGTAIQRIPVREIEIPVPPLAQQRAIHATIDKAREAKRLATQASDAADSLTTAILNAVRHGASLTSNTTEGTTR